MAITVGGLHTPHRDFGEDEPEAPRDNPKGDDNAPHQVREDRRSEEAPRLHGG